MSDVNLKHHDPAIGCGGGPVDHPGLPQPPHHLPILEGEHGGEVAEVAGGQVGVQGHGHRDEGARLLVRRVR